APHPSPPPSPACGRQLLVAGGGCLGLLALGVLEDDALFLLLGAARLLLPAQLLLLAAARGLLEELLLELVEAPPSVGGQPGVVEERVDESGLPEKPDLVDDERILRRAGHRTGESEERFVVHPAAADDAFEHEGVQAVPSDRVELLRRRLGTVEEPDEVVRRHGLEGRARGGRDVGIAVEEHREQRTNPVVVAEWEESLRRE